EARAQARNGLYRWHNEYNVETLKRPGNEPYDSPDDAVDRMAFAEDATAVIGTPDDLVSRIRDLYELTGGFGAVIGFAHDWANPEHTFRSWDLIARHVVPEVKGMLAPMRASQRYVIENRESFERAREAVVTKIMENDRAAAALSVAPTARMPMGVGNNPDVSGDVAAVGSDEPTDPAA
ncbi:MAG: flavin-dependent oxidoreductase, partial [Actinomycetota bacterium]